MFDFLIISLYTFLTTLIAVAFGFVLAKNWLDKRLNQKPVQAVQKDVTA